MSLNATHFAQCPYCWQSLEVEVEETAGSLEFVEDCQVCCRPIVFTWRGASGGGLQARPENE